MTVLKAIQLHLQHKERTITDVCDNFAKVVEDFPNLEARLNSMSTLYKVQNLSVQW